MMCQDQPTASLPVPAYHEKESIRCPGLFPKIL